MYYQGKEVRGIMDEKREIWITEHAGDSVYAEDAVELYAVYEKETLIGLREATEEEEAQWSQMRQQTAGKQEEWEDKLQTEMSKTETDTILSYVKQQDGKTYYSWDDGETWIPLSDEGYEALFPTSDVEW